MSESRIHVYSIAIDKLRNTAIIAHVDHGKTTLVDKLLQQSKFQSLVVKLKSVSWIRMTSKKSVALPSLLRTQQSTGMIYCINIVDTPGHAGLRW
ncbi:GTP-binding protein [Vibrio chagasii]|nr:GTP-binding protein [Vibrio chagasii]